MKGTFASQGDEPQSTLQGFKLQVSKCVSVKSNTYDP